MSTNDRPLDATREANHSLRDKDYMLSRMRDCHDCGKKTWDYRCPECTAKWRKRHGVSPSETEIDE